MDQHLLQGIAAVRSSPPSTPSRRPARRDSSISLDNVAPPSQIADGKLPASAKSPRSPTRHASPQNSNPSSPSPSPGPSTNPLDVYLRDDNKIEAMLTKGAAPSTPTRHRSREAASASPRLTVEQDDEEQSLPPYPASLDKGKGIAVSDHDDPEPPVTPDNNGNSLDVGLSGTYISVSSNFGDETSSDSGIVDPSPSAVRPLKRRRRRLDSREPDDDGFDSSVLKTTFMRAADRATMGRSATLKSIRLRVHKESDRSADDEASD